MLRARARACACDGNAMATARARARARASAPCSLDPRCLLCACLRFDGRGIKRLPICGKWATKRGQYAKVTQRARCKRLATPEASMWEGMHADGCAVHAGGAKRCASSGRWRSECSEGGTRTAQRGGGGGVHMVRRRAKHHNMCNRWNECTGPSFVSREKWMGPAVVASVHAGSSEFDAPSCCYYFFSRASFDGC